MAAPKRDKPSIRLFVTTNMAHGKRLQRIAVKATEEAGAIVSANTLHARGMPALLACLESCEACRDGKCDGSAHVRRDVKHEKLITLEPMMHGPPAEREMVTPVESPRAPVPIATGQAALFEPPPTPPAKTSKRARAKKEVTPESPEFTRLIDVYHLEFVRVRGEKPAYTSRDFAAFKALLKDHGFDRACELVRNAFTDPFWSKRVTVRKIADDPSTFVGAIANVEPSAIQGGGKDKLPW